VPDRDDLTRLFVRDLDEIPLPARERWRPAPRKESFLMNAGRTFAFAAAAIGVLVLAIVASVALRPQEPVAASPAPSASAITTSATPAATPSPASSGTTTASTSPSPTASATPGAFSPQGPGRYISVLGYAIDTPTPWHKTACAPPIVQGGVVPGGELFVPVSVHDETTSDIGSAYTTLGVMAQPNPQNLTPRQWAQQDPTGQAGEQIEDVTYAQRPAARKSLPLSAPGTGLFKYYVANAGRMYIVEPDVRAPLADPIRQSLVAMIDSFRFISDAELAAARAALPTAPPARSPEQVADGVAAAFAAKDVSALATFLSACVTTGAEQAGAATVSREKYLEDLRAAFAAGLVVTVQPRPITGDRATSDVRIASTWKDSRGTKLKSIMLRAVNDRWEVWGTIERSR
jgi:hypothetical protein